jgi:hypothetical protein
VSARRDATFIPEEDIHVFVPRDALPTRLPDANCGGLSVPLTRRDANVIFVIDRSGSMADVTTDGVPKWTALGTALDTVLRRFGDEISIGMAFFPIELPPRESGVYSPEEICQVPGTLALEPRPFQVLQLLDRFNATVPAASLRAVRQWYAAHPDLTGDRYVILATDGGPNCNQNGDPTTCRCTGGAGVCALATNMYARVNCLDERPAIDEVQALAREGVRTYVLGLNGTQDFADVLNRMADAGERPRAGEARYYPANSASELLNELGRITVALADCTLRLAMPPPDPNLVDVRLDGRSLYRDPRRRNGWDWGDDAHREIVFHGPVCDEVRKGTGGSRLVAAFGCSAPAPP